MHFGRPAVALAAVLGGVTLLAGCSGGTATKAAPSPSQSLFTPSPCPTTAGAPTKWPAIMPADIPKPANATIQKVDTTSDGVKIVRYVTPTSLRESVLFIVGSYPKAGYALGRGDAEATEADAPFVHGQTRGVTRLSQLAQCQTLWLTATVNGTSPAGGSPLLPSRSPTSTASPLPFG